jgi:DNA-binding Xre family transcriptional regulator
MIVSYKKLWKLLIDKDMTKTQLRIASGVSSSTMAKMTRGEDIQVSVLVRLCQTLKCDVGDIVQFIPDDEYSFSPNA